MLPTAWQSIEVLKDWESQIGNLLHVVIRLCQINHHDFKMLFLLIFSHIILMLADDMACNARNPRPGETL
jgi:hypothetical protein